LCPIRIFLPLDRRPKGAIQELFLQDLTRHPQRHKSSLRELYLDLADEWDFYHLLDAFPALSDFIKLQRFTTNMNTLGDVFFGPAIDADDDEEAEETQRTWLEDVETDAPLDDATMKLSDVLPPFLKELVVHTLVMPNYADAGYDHRQLDHLARHRLHSLPSLKRIKYVRGTTSHPFDEESLPPISQYANCNDDGFAFVVSSLGDRGSEHGTSFFVADMRTRAPTEYVR
jgi:hypothetical protein